MKIAYTIATANFLAQASVAQNSFLGCNPEFKGYIFLLDRCDGIDLLPFENITVTEIAALHFEEFPEMVHSYSVFELSNALKPFVGLYLFEYLKADVVVYFDSDILFFSSLKILEHSDFTIAITPHVCSPIPVDDLHINEKTFLNAGLYNGGFVCLVRSDETLRFLSWWKERLKNDCRIDLCNGLFVDQLWLNLVPFAFKGVRIVLDPVYKMVSNDEYRYTPFLLTRYLQNSGFYNIRIEVLGGWDASLAQILGKWYQKRLMKKRYKKWLGCIIKKVVRGFVIADQRFDRNNFLKNGVMVTGLTGLAFKNTLS